MRILKISGCWLLLLVLALAACKKKVEAVKQDLLVEMIIASKWKVTVYKSGKDTVTAEFDPYLFKFNKDFTVNALRNNTIETTGNWNGSIETKTIESQFPNPNPVLARLNGTWLIKDSGLDFVIATQTIGSTACYLRLDAR